MGDVTGVEGLLRSAIYEGRVVHHRTAGAITGPAHHFEQPVAMLYLDLDEIDQVVALHPLWRASPGLGAVRITRRDLPGDPHRPAGEALGDLAASHVGRRLSGPITVLTHPRTWGWQFNPISCAYCFDGDDQIGALVAEVTNTPWHERTTYVVGAPGSHDVAKTMHVSPFLPMDLCYRLTYGAPGEQLSLTIDVTPCHDAGTVLLHTALLLDRRPASRQSLGRLLWRYPLMSMRVSAGIYAQAARLRLAGAPVHPHPDRRLGAGDGTAAPFEEPRS